MVGLDWTIDPEEARSVREGDGESVCFVMLYSSPRAIVGDNVTLQGNLDQCALYATEV